MLQFEKEAWAEGHHRVAGVDEAGRGPWAGPVVAAAVIFEPSFLETEESGLLKGLTDSKKLSESRREHFFGILHQSPAVHLAVGIVEPADIDKLNILQATRKAMGRALSALEPGPDFALVDGRKMTGLPFPSLFVVRGDSRSLSIAAASVIAKVTRDRIMVQLDEKYPAYGFAHHKGYGTKEHSDALRQHGPCSIHRHSFRPVREWNLLL